MSDENYWVVTASADHAARGRAEGIVQAGHGKDAPLRRMHPGDGVVVYSPRATYPDGPPVAGLHPDRAGHRYRTLST